MEVEKLTGSERANRMREESLNIFGGKCEDCRITNEQSLERYGKPLEFHHKVPSGQGMGRGSYNRASEVKLHPERFSLLCDVCHKRRHKTGNLEGEKADAE